MHKLLKEQIKFLLNDEIQQNNDLALFINAVNDTYIKTDFEIDALECLLRFLSENLNEKIQILEMEKKERTAIESHLNYVENFDKITGLVNRNLLKDRMQQAISMANRYNQLLVVLIIGLDSFKLVNETFGLSAGDRLLKLVGDRLTSHIRENDTVAHLSGDEFVLVLSPMAEDNEQIILAGTNNDTFSFNTKLEIGLQRVLDIISQPLEIDGEEIQITCSIGASVYPHDGDNMEDLLRHAGTALAKAKKIGQHNFQFYTSDSGEKAKEKLLMYGQLKRALVHNELILHYQPQIDLSTGYIAGMEALIRWCHPDLGLLAPAHFIPLAEETGLIIPIGEWVIKTVGWKIKKWQETGLGKQRIAVNLSARQFSNANLVQSIANMLEETGIDPHCFDIELTESHVMKDVGRAISVLRSIKNLGVQLSIDDFGTGYSSLAYLKRFPIDVLKIDQSFVHDITNNTDGAVISKAIISMAHNLGLRVIAEGVETEAQCEFLSKNMCDEIQGFLYSKSLNEDDIEVLLHEHRRLPEHLLHFYENPRTLLLVDDEENNLTAMKRLLRYENYQILSAINGIDGLAILSNNKVDVVISDHRMPGMTGVEFLRIVKEKYPSIVRIMLTGQADIQAVIAAINEGSVFQFLTKPCRDDQLMQHINEAFKLKKLEDDNRRLNLEILMTNRDLIQMNRD